MDIVLEGFDYYIFDKFYASLFPISLNGHLPTSISKNLKLGNYSSTLNDYIQLQKQSSLNDDNEHLIKLTKEYITEKDIYGYFAKFFPENEDMYLSIFSRNHLFREFLSLMIVMTIFGWILYLTCATFSYRYVFDKEIFNHPRYLKNQMSLEIKQAVSAIPIMVLCTVPWFMLDINGYSNLYLNVNETSGAWPYGWKAIFFEYFTFIMFTDCGIYLIHRWLHWPKVYKMFHKPHHKWIVTTPFASHAFNPFDGYFQSVPYHIYPALFPLNKVSYLILFTFVNFWTVMIHDGEYLTNDPVVNGAACHTVHHLYFNYNYGQFTTLWDRLGGSYRKPERELFDKSKKKEKQTWEKQIEKMEKIRNTVEGKNDDRVYGTENFLLKKKK
ncbi:C-5 sterol desaturase ASCRUDRAFT_75930 [Ascoidea rubescens DSM 1968]|uniref:Fatty acid hydroxylase domain-containing protein n=1 Tax=Ascoidea rubescens DSM 1968 TaxID=1344418 RepID=A0A1D2VHV9_9ASCO|nr:hypothetical protein ASCRUDRAFT_75930 [Ascoidea rubescens DSM 1968]ODV61228.1 hypothetical protein ASCRUDRAFT_75930 [Ascoidea rubescens DSM 1968]